MESQEALVEEIRDELIEGKTGTYGFGLVYEGGKKYFRPSAPCYAYVFYPSEEHQELDIDYMIVNPGLYNHPSRIDLHKGWLSWILHESPWAPYYLTKDVEEAYNRGVVLSTHELSFPMMMQAATLIRVPLEHSDTVDVWNKARRFIPDEYALMLGHITSGMTYYKDTPSFKSHSFVSSSARTQLYGWVNRLPTPHQKFPARESSRFSTLSWKTAWLNNSGSYTHTNPNCSINTELLKSPRTTRTFSPELNKNTNFPFPTTDNLLKKFCEDFVIRNTLEDECVKKAA